MHVVHRATKNVNNCIIWWKCVEGYQHNRPRNCCRCQKFISFCTESFPIPRNLSQFRERRAVLFLMIGLNAVYLLHTNSLHALYHHPWRWYDRKRPSPYVRYRRSSSSHFEFSIGAIKRRECRTSINRFSNLIELNTRHLTSFVNVNRLLDSF